MGPNLLQLEVDVSGPKFFFFIAFFIIISSRTLVWKLIEWETVIYLRAGVTFSHDF